MSKIHEVIISSIRKGVNKVRQTPDVVDDPEIQQAVGNLNDRLCSYERATGREHLLLIIPLDTELISAADVHLSMSGKPIFDRSAKKDFLEFNAPAVLKKII